MKDYKPGFLAPTGIPPISHRSPTSLPPVSRYPPFVGNGYAGDDAVACVMQALVSIVCSNHHEAL